ncbi:hypothetical protein HPB48_001073 [Haemaphysalis longicornis]|uniref:tRNA pseudouridine(55) synthase n=1 Tax=Haemaphysalis longicornis TaxID=44386 RepID=A0A9J6GY90_HAELO|nr:hypothetical protein HPB48_001073 [Haemaphysalis longicornis]
MPLKLSDENKPAVFEYLREIGCCKFCAERFTGERYYDHYKTFRELAVLSGLESSEASVQPSDEPSSKRPKLDADGSCDEPAKVEDSGEDHMAESHDPSGTSNGTEDSSDVCVACYSLLEVPHLKASFDQHAVVLHLKDKFEESYKESNDIDFVSAKEVWKYVMGPMFADQFGADFSATSGFQVLVTLPSPNAEEECGFLLKEFPESFPNRKQRKRHTREVFTRNAVLDALRKISDEDFKRLYKCPPNRPARLTSKTEVSCVHAPIYLAGRYCKYSRLLSQTPWILNDKRIMESSVQELITDVISKHIPCERRPFILEVFKTKKPDFTSSELEAIEQVGFN